MKKLTVLFSLIFLYVHGSAQVNLPEIFFLNYQQHYAVINPAHLGFDEPKLVNLRYGGYNGVKNVLRSIYADGVFNPIDSLRIRTGLQFYAFHEGEYIRYNNIKWTNSYSITDKYSYKITIAMSAGLINYAYVNNTEIASDWGPDLDIGVWAKFQKLHIGISGKQILPTILKPVQTNFTTNKIIHFLMLYEWYSRPFTKIESGIHYTANSFIFHDIPLSLYNTLIYKNLFDISLHLNGMSMLTAGVGIRENKAYHIPIGLNLAFQQIIAYKNITPNNRYEIGIQKSF